MTMKYIPDKTIPDKTIKILIVDDDKWLGDVLKDHISGPDLQIEVFEDGAKAIEAINREKFDLVLTDLMMPEVGGLDVLRFAKEANPECFVIIMTGYASLETAIEAIREGAYDYIRKPFKLQEMELVINNAVDKIRLIRENKKLVEELHNLYRKIESKEKESKSKDKSTDNRAQKRRITRLNFFSQNMPSLHYIGYDSKDYEDCIKGLEKIAHLKKQGLLNDEEFGILKRYLLRGAESA